MSKKLTKISLTILTLVCAFCMSIAMIGVAKADTTLYQATDFKMENAVQIRQDGTNGIRFWASMSADDYNNLKDVAGIEFGIMIAPTDWLANGSPDELRFGNDALPEWQDGTDATKYFAKGINVPILDVDDFDQDDNVTEYLLHASFVNIKDSNFSRSFTAKAYYRVGDEVVYAQGENKKNIFETASKYVAMSDFDETDPKEKFVKDYVYGIVDKVAEVYTNITVDVAGVQDGVAYRDDQVSATAILKKPGDDTKELKAQLKVALTQNDEEVENGVVYDAETQKFELATSGIFKLKGKLGSKLVGDGVDLTLKRRDVSVNVTTRRATTNYKTFENVADQTKVLSSYTGSNKVDAVNGSVNLLYTVTDPENTSARISNANAELINNNQHKNWQLKRAENMDYLMWLAPGYKTTSGETVSTIGFDETIFRANYTDSYGVTYSYELPCYYDMNDEVVYGKDDTKFTATDALFLNLDGKGSSHITIQNVPMTSVKTDNLFAFSYYTTSRQKSIRIKVSESGNPSNFLEARVSFGSTTYLGLGMTTSLWNDATYGARQSNASLSKLVSAPGESNLGHYYNTFDFFKCKDGGNLYNHDAENYMKEVLGFSVVDSELYFTASKSGNISTQTINTKAQQEATTAVADLVYSGLDDVEYVDLTFTVWYAVNAPMSFIVTELGGETVDESWIKKSYFSPDGTLFAD